MMDRRRFLLTLGAGALVVPLATGAQSLPQVQRVGLLAAVPRSAPGVRAFEDRLRAVGATAGRRIALDFRTGNGRYDVLSLLATELARLSPDVFVAGGSEATVRALQQVAGSRPTVIVAIDLAYGPPLTGMYADAATLVGKILSGAKAPICPWNGPRRSSSS
jgi:hypothetical protein